MCPFCGKDGVFSICFDWELHKIQKKLLFQDGDKEVYKDSN